MNGVNLFERSADNFGGILLVAGLIAGLVMFIAQSL